MQVDQIPHLNIHRCDEKDEWLILLNMLIFMINKLL